MWRMEQGTAFEHAPGVEYEGASGQLRRSQLLPAETHWAVIQQPGLASVSLHLGCQRKLLPWWQLFLARVTAQEPVQGADGTGDSPLTCVECVRMRT